MGDLAPGGWCPQAARRELAKHAGAEEGGGQLLAAAEQGGGGASPLSARGLSQATVKSLGATATETVPLELARGKKHVISMDHGAW
jgi:hypothetical protein